MQNPHKPTYTCQREAVLDSTAKSAQTLFKLHGFDFFYVAGNKRCRFQAGLD